MYQEDVTTQEEALSHLFLHCCFRDGDFTEEETKIIAEKLVAAGLNKELNFKEEVLVYKTYRPEITNEQEYLQHLIDLIKPTNELALYSYCLELCLSDSSLGTIEESLLQTLASIIDLEESEQDVIKRLMVQRKIIETQKIF